MDKELNKKNDISPKEWWENRRWKYNKICLAYFGIISIIILILGGNSAEGQSIARVVVIGLIFIVLLLNIFYTIFWVVEYLSVKKSNTYFDLNKRKYQYVLFVIFTITFPFFIIIIGTKIK
ncbi:MAG: hypothetical protein IPL21_10400 [Saprospirales bacterium]|nr:hypothetical protein [Saprospirales bacterium]